MWIKYVSHTPDFYSLNGFFWPPKYRFKANIRVNIFAISFNIEHLVWSDHRAILETPQHIFPLVANRI